MMKTALVAVLLLFTTALCFAQNLVPNPSFEEHTQCPNNGGQIDYALYWTNPLIGSSPDYLNSCGTPAWNTPSNLYGFEPAHSGLAYSSIVTARYSPFNPQVNNAREYLQVELLDTLSADIDYCISFFVSAADSMHYVSDNIGIYFSPTEIHDTCANCNLVYSPQFENDTTNLSSRVGWTEISGRYKAIGGEKFIVIGNFRDTVTTVATYVGWGGNQGFFYALYYIDDVSLTVCDSLTSTGGDFGLSKIGFYPNPSKAQLHCTLSNIKGRLVDLYGRSIVEFDTRQSKEIDIEDVPDGTYILVYEYEGKRYVTKQVVIH